MRFLPTWSPAPRRVKIEIVLATVGEKLTKVQACVGIFDDEEMPRTILDKIKASR
jgi:hypothetical protein